MTIQDLLWQGVEKLEHAQVPDAALDARYLLLEAFHLTLASFLAEKQRELLDTSQTREKKRVYEALIEKRARRVPLQHLMGVQEFMGYEFLVNEHVLIPRQDTETLVELVLEECERPGLRVLDMCAGSGCIGIALALMGSCREVTAVDVSRDALQVIRRNAAKLLAGYKGTFNIVESDMFEDLGNNRRFDLIVSNPPYIPSRIIGELEPEVRDFEPRLALDGAEDGLEFYRILAQKCREYLEPGGRVYMEIGYDQAGYVEKLFAENGYVGIRTVKDLAGQDRVTRAVRP